MIAVAPLSCAFSDNLIPGTFTRPIFADIPGSILALFIMEYDVIPGLRVMAELFRVCIKFVT